MRIIFSASLWLSVAVLFAADAPVPQPADPMLWNPPAGAPPISTRVELDRSAMNSALARVNFVLDARHKYPEVGVEITFVAEGSRAAKAGLSKGDVMTKLDGKPLRNPVDFTGARTDNTQKVALYSSAKGAVEIDLEPGLLGMQIRRFERMNPLGLTGNWSNPQWADEVMIASYLLESSPEIAEAALAKAVQKGMDQNAVVNRLFAYWAIGAHRFDEAMAFAWAALKEVPDDASATLYFITAATQNYKLQALVDFLKAHPKHPEAAHLEALEEMVKEHKVLPDARRIRLSPRTAAKKMFKDDLTIRAEEFAYWALPDAEDEKNGKDKKPEKAEGAGKTDTEMPEKEKSAKLELVQSRSLETLLQKHRYTIERDPGFYFFHGVKTSAKNLYVRCEFDIKLTDKTSRTRFTDHFRIAVFPYDAKKGPTLGDHADMLSGLGLSVTPGYSNYLKLNHFLPCFTRNLPNVNPKERNSVNNPLDRHELVLVAVDGEVEMLFDGQRVFYGPLGIPDSPLVLTLSAVGTTVHIWGFDVFELMTDSERDTRVKPEINKGYALSRTRLHSAAANYDAPYIKSLLDLGAKFDAVDDWGLTPLEFALYLRNYCPAMKEVGAPATLRAACAYYGADPIAIVRAARPPPPKDEIISALHFAAKSSNSEAVLTLLENGFDVNTQSKPPVGVSTPLHWAVHNSDTNIVALLLSKGADLDAKNFNGQTPLDVAREMKKTAFVKVMEDWQKGIKTPYRVFKQNNPQPPAPVKPPRPPDDVF